MVFVSRSYTSKEIESIPDYLYSKLRPKFLSGCVVDKIYDGLNVGHGISLFLGGFNHNTPVNIGNESIREKNVKFRYDGFNVEGPRKEYKTKSVGRWTSPEELKNQFLEISNGWYEISKFQSVSSAPKIFSLPKELKVLRDNNISPDLFFIISDSEPYQFLESLDHYFPKSKKESWGTKPEILILSKIRKTVDLIIPLGVAVTSETSTMSNLLIDHPSLRPISDPLRITRCQGNIILELEGLNPTESLLRHFKSGVDQENNFLLSKETEFYMGLYDVNHEDALHDSEMVINRILSGDPAKGNMAIDTTKDLKNGQYVKETLFGGNTAHTKFR
ncbi:17302_t:CDS:2 [Acaulospora colombiana]|uniref:17302_t:CDS:1 n=1 Tax=Acaulospora colombiana TaxID=27376 RepID=A0ACA9KUB3_9GLOM|nr:17302_t:CDS:2 [Acaulospora colombiana]